MAIQLFQRVSPAEETVWSNLMCGLSMCDYKLVLQQFMDAYGLEKSTVSERFIEASRQKLEEWMSRSLEYLPICALLLDGTMFKGQHRVVAIVMNALGRKVVLGLVQGAPENAQVVSGLLDHLAERGLDFSPPRLYQLEGSRALRAAIQRPGAGLGPNQRHPCTASALPTPRRTQRVDAPRGGQPPGRASGDPHAP